VVTPNVLWRGAKPAQDGAAWLIQRGVRTIVNLELLHDDRRVFGEARPASAGRHEAGYFRISDWEPNAVIAPALLDDHVAHFLAVVDHQPKPVYVHCRSGQNRTGVMSPRTESSSRRKRPRGDRGDGALPGNLVQGRLRYIRSLSPKRREEIRRKAAAWISKLERDSSIVCENGKCQVSQALSVRFFVASPAVFKESPMKITRNLGMLLLAAWLILTGLIPLFSLSFSGLGTVMAILAIASGVLIVVGR